MYSFPFTSLLFEILRLSDLILVSKLVCRSPNLPKTNVDSWEAWIHAPAQGQGHGCIYSSYFFASDFFLFLLRVQIQGQEWESIRRLVSMHSSCERTSAGIPLLLHPDTKTVWPALLLLWCSSSPWSWLRNCQTRCCWSPMRCIGSSEYVELGYMSLHLYLYEYALLTEVSLNCKHVWHWLAVYYFSSHCSRGHISAELRDFPLWTFLFSHHECDGWRDWFCHKYHHLVCALVLLRSHMYNDRMPKWHY